MSTSESSSSENEDEPKDPNHVDWRNMENIRVICRFRPINSREIREEKSAHLVDSPPEITNSGTCVRVRRDGARVHGSPMEFYLDKILGSNTTQQNLYINVGKPMVEACLEGYNSTIFAYGQTGSGKTYTMFGPEKQKLKSNNELGCVQRCISFLFTELQQRIDLKSVTEWKVLLHFVQMYREKLLDLLEPDKGIPLKIRYDPQTDSPYVPNLKQVDVTEMLEVMKLLSLANKNRITDKTEMNAVSSRSHMIMTLSIEQTLKDGTVKKSKLNFADLAGSETFQKALGGRGGAVDRKKMEELKTINLSLTNLTTCINYLSKGRNPSYRSSQLTFYLMDSLGGNSKTTLIVAASPHIFNRTETISTLRFAKTAKSVKNKAKVNKSLSKAQLLKLVKKLRRENKKLKARLALVEGELSKNGIELPVEAEKKRRIPKRSKSMRAVLSPSNKELFHVAGSSNVSGELKALAELQETIAAPTTTAATGGKKRSVEFGKVEESVYNKLKSELKSLQSEFNQQEIEASILNDQLQKKNLMLTELTDELHSSRNRSSQLDTLEEDKRQLQWQLEHMKEGFKTEQEETLQQYEVIMGDMKLSNEQLVAEVNSLRESIASLQEKDKMDKKEKRIESLSQSIKHITTAYDGKKDTIISNLCRENKELKQQIIDLKLNPRREIETGDSDEDGDEDELFDLNDQLEYLENIGKGFDIDMDVKQTAHNPAQLALWRQDLEVGSKMDCLDEACLWWTATVTDCDGYRIKVRYDGFDARWDEWVDRGSTRIAPHLSKAKGGRESKGVAVHLKVVATKKDKQTGKVRRVYKQGFLVKQGKRIKSYRTRYFVLMDDGSMEYFKKMTDETPAGSFNIRNMIETRRIAYPNQRDLYGFEIVTNQRTWRFQAHSDEVVAEWIGVIHAVSKGVEPNDEDGVQSVVYSGYDRMYSNINEHISNGGHVRSLSIQEECSSHPPINRAAFSQLLEEKEDNEQVDVPNISILIAQALNVNNKSRPETHSPVIIVTDDDKEDAYDDMMDLNIQHSGWMHKAGKWDANWTYRYCVLTEEEQDVTLRCYLAPNKKETHCIYFKHVSACIELKASSDIYARLEVPTAFAFQLITSSRIYAFACKSKHEVNVWFKKIRKVVQPSSKKANKFNKRSSFITIGSNLNKLGTSFGRLIGVTKEHVTTTEVLKTENVEIQPYHNKLHLEAPTANLNNRLRLNSAVDTNDISNGRRHSQPIILDGIPPNIEEDRRKSAPELRSFSFTEKRQEPTVQTVSDNDDEKHLDEDESADEDELSSID